MAHIIIYYSCYTYFCVAPALYILCPTRCMHSLESKWWTWQPAVFEIIATCCNHWTRQPHALCRRTLPSRRGRWTRSCGSSLDGKPVLDMLAAFAAFSYLRFMWYPVSGAGLLGGGGGRTDHLLDSPRRWWGRWHMVTLALLCLLSFQFWVLCPSSLRMISPLQKEAVKAWHSNPSFCGEMQSCETRGIVSGNLRDMPKCTVFFENIIVGLAWWHALIRNCGTADGFVQEILPDNGPPRCFWAAIM